MAVEVKLDSKFSIGVILALVIQTASIVWWASGINATVQEGVTVRRELVSQVGDLTRSVIRLQEQTMTQTEIRAQMQKLADELVSVKLELAGLRKQLPNK